MTSTFLSVIVIINYYHLYTYRNKNLFFLLLKNIQELTECLINTMNYNSVCCTYIKIKMCSLIWFTSRNFHRFNDNSLRVIVLPRTLNTSRASKRYHLSGIRVVCAYRLDLIFNL